MTKPYFSAMYRNYPAKLLLFGEYTVLTGSRALAIPVDGWSGRWMYAEGDERLTSFADHIEATALAERFNASNFRESLSNGLQFRSDIPVGYGLGSSAALTAAVYDCFCDKASKATDIANDLAMIENAFHGKSSGMDPLVCLCAKPILREGHGYMDVDMAGDSAMMRVFLIDSGVQRSTAPLVETYRTRSRKEQFETMVLRPLQQSVDHAISFFIDEQWDIFFEHLTIISDLQLQHFAAMIPENLQGVWRASLDTGDVRMKLCGAGGGGYYLGFALDGADLQMFSEFEVILPQLYRSDADFHGKSA